MPSPFPGMDPYLEDPGLWPDVHHELISTARHTLTERLRPKYSVRIEDRVYPVEPVEATTLIEEEIHESRIEVIDRKDRTVVTVIEILSPANKVAGSQGRLSYDRKRREVMHSPSHFVGIDLLRGGAGFSPVETLSPHDYRVHVSRAQRRPRGTVWPIRLDQRLPMIPIPLLDGDPDAELDLQAVLDASYDLADYGQEVDYHVEPAPPLTFEQARWADGLLRERGLR